MQNGLWRFEEEMNGVAGGGVGVEIDLQKLLAG